MSHRAKLERFEKIISGFPKANVLVIGDIMLDHYVRGKVTRISPEAPVPVVHVTSENLMPGGAANVAMNLRALSVNTSIIGTIGEDIHGHSLKLELKKAHINTQGVTRLENIQTTKKTRVIAHSQQIVRFDYETPRDLTGEDEKKIIRHLRKMIPSCQGIIIEDYGKGTITQNIMTEIASLCAQHKVFSSYDPKIGHELSCAGFDIATPNTEEANYLAKTLKKHIGKIPEHGDHLRSELGLKQLLVTLGEDGMVLFKENEKPFRVPAKAREVFDVSGAGDTVISVYTTAIVCGAEPFEATYLANMAGGIVVGKLGTATASPEEILTAVETDLG